jgi:hypothetical protein
VDGFDRVDNVLLELLIAMALRPEPGAAIQVAGLPDYSQVDTLGA